MPDQSFNVLLTSAGGIGSVGMLAIRYALIEAGLGVITVAPGRARSGASRSVSMGQPVTMVRDGGDEHSPIYRSGGTPVDCVRAALLSGLAQGVDLVVSGIAEGANLGDDATCSATVGAAVEGALLGRPAIAISQQAPTGRSDWTGDDFRWCATVGAELAAWLIINPPPPRSVLNVNAPAALKDRRIKVATLDQWVCKPPASIEGEAGCLTFAEAGKCGREFAMRAGSDASAIGAGHVSLTPISLDFGDGKAASRLRRWTAATLERIHPRLGAGDGQCRAGCCG